MEGPPGRPLDRDSFGNGSPQERLLARLRAALQGRYTIERELGHGGMGRVYLARDLKHGREVAIKTLHPELASSVGGQRFLQEIETAARLAHPHILGMHDSGDADGVLYYIMPYVAGESLRDRLQREARLPIEDAVRVARDIADALAYAHERGIVHRDLKPENVLLLGPANAVLTDFGLARAVHTAVNRRITPTGLTIGSPLYMSPEQVRGDREIDGRADIYSLGCVLYEMLTGEPPFGGATAAAVARRKVEGSPPRVRAYRPEIPPALEEVVSRAMATRPDERYQTASELEAALARPFAPRRTRRVRWATLALVAGVAALAVLTVTRYVLPGRSTLLAEGILREREPILVADFQSPSGDTVLAEAVTEAFRTDLARTPLATVLEPRRVREALRRMERPDSIPLTPPLAREVALREGIRAVVTGEITSVGGGYLLSAALISPGSEEPYASARATARDSTALLEAVDALSHEIRRRIGESLLALGQEEPLEQVTTHSLEALRKYSQAVRAIDGHGDYPRGVALLEEAVAIDPGFAMGYRKLGIALANLTGQDARALRMLARAYEHRSRLTERERYLAEADYHDAIGDLDRAITAYRTVLEIYPTYFAALNNLAHVYSRMGDYPRAVRFYSAAVAADSSAALGLSNLIEAHFNAGHPDTARMLLRRMQRRFPEHPYSIAHEALLAAAVGDFAAADTHTRRLAERHRDNVGWRIDSSRWMAALAGLHGLPDGAEPHLRTVMEEQRLRGSRGGYLAAAAYGALLDVHVRGERGAALRRLERALRTMSLDSVEPRDRPYVALARAYADAGEPGLARSLIRRMEVDADPSLARVVENDRRAMLGAIQLAEGRPELALSALAGVRPPTCTLCELPYRARAHAEAGRPDSAIALYERYLRQPYLYRLIEDGIWLAPTHERLATLYEERGNREAAAVHLRRLVELWSGSEPALRGRLDSARARLAAISAAAPTHGPALRGE